MPNVLPRGLFARSGGTWKPPANVWARVAGTWKQADYVWAFHNGAWQLIWGRVPATPATATATWVQPATVRIDWTAPAINPNTQWIVRRSDNSIVGTVPVGTLTITDTRPLLASGTTADAQVPAYTVEGSDGTVSSAPRTTNTVTYNLTAASLTNTVALASAATGNVTLNWTPNATYGDPQGWQAYLDGYGWVGSVLPGTARTTTITGQARGASQTWRIVPMTQNAAGAWVQAGNANPTIANIQASPPTGQSLFASGISNLRFTWNLPSGTATGFEVQYYYTGWVGYTTVGPGTTVVDFPTTQAAYMRVRTLAAGGASDWAQAGPTAPVNDVTGPPAVAITVGAWNVGAGGYELSWPAHYDPSGNSATYLQYAVNNGGWQTVTGVALPAGPAGSTINGSAGRGNLVKYRLWMIDSLNNQTIGPETANYWTRPLGGVVVYPNASYTWGSTSGFGWMGNDRCVGGAFGGNENYGFWWYGTQIADICKGFTPDRMFFDCQKVNGLSAAGVAYIAWHNQANYDGSVPGVGAVFHAPNLNVAEDNTQFGAGWYPGFANGSYKGACVIGNGQPFKALYGKSENGNSGAITIYFDQ